MTNKKAICRAVDLKKTYLRGSVAVDALQGVSINILPNDYISIMGPSGSGKSTLVHILSCLDSPTSGEYYLEGKLVSNYSDIYMTYGGIKSILRKDHSKIPNASSYLTESIQEKILSKQDKKRFTQKTLKDFF